MWTTFTTSFLSSFLGEQIVVYVWPWVALTHLNKSPLTSCDKVNLFLRQALGSMATNGSVHTDTWVNDLYCNIDLNREVIFWRCGWLLETSRVREIGNHVGLLSFCVDIIQKFHINCSIYRDPFFVSFQHFGLKKGDIKIHYAWGPSILLHSMTFYFITEHNVLTLNESNVAKELLVHSGGVMWWILMNS